VGAAAGDLADRGWDARALLAALLCLAIALGFWLGSRYPDLGEKASMGGTTILEDPLGFEAARPVEATDPFTTRVLDTTLNWISTNQRGMAFGIAMAAATMTLLRRLGRARFRGAFANTLLGVVIGAPLGVCVNCAAPIARGLHAAGSRLETSLAAMISSPTLNFVVLAMLFAMFPLYIAAIKLSAALLFILGVIPLLSRTVFRKEREAGAGARRPGSGDGWGPAAGDALFEQGGGWGAALRWVGAEFARNLWFIVRYTVPLMLLAGLIGAIAVTVLPWDELVAMLPHDDSWDTALWMVALGAFGLLLPVPMAFDVVVSGALWAAGMPTPYVVVLLFSLGVFSIYSFLVVWEAISLRVAVGLAVSLLFVSVAAGRVAQRYELHDGAQQRALFASLIATHASAPPAPAPALPPATPAPALLAALARDALSFAPFEAEAPPGIRVEERPFATARTAGPSLFRRHYGGELGIERVDHLPLAYKFTTPLYRAWPITAGDIHGDGWPDLVLGSDQGLLVYANRGGRRFELQEIEADVPRAHVGNLALVDLDGDGWLDILYSAVLAGNHALYNRGGRFPADGQRALPATAAGLADALAFGDLDRDGRLDVVLGNIAAGRWGRRPPEGSRNAVLRGGPHGFRSEPLPDRPGQTLASLVSDIDGDGHLDVLIGNDFEPPDFFLRGSASGALTPWTRADGVIPASTTNTMSMDSADVDNDLSLEIYVAQVAQNPRRSVKGLTRDTDTVCAEHSDPVWRRRCEEHMAVHETLRDARRGNQATACRTLADPILRDDCIAFAMFEFIVRNDRDASACGRFPPRWRTLADLCRGMFEPQAAASDQPELEIPQLRNRNVLLAADGRGFRDRADELGVAIGGWSWNARFADVDNDEWQDLYVVNGHFPSERRESNLFYRNRSGRDFENATVEANLVSSLPAGAYVYVDFDDDGDLDIVTVNFDDPVWVHRNESAGGGSIVFELADGRGNPFGIGSRITVHYGPGEARHQLREIKAGGGHASSEEPRAHFGLAEHPGVTRVEVRWSTGETTTLRGDFRAGHRYRIRRDPAPGADPTVSARS
jgi:uncharacterized membrane protein YraQ (UPF0718 family)